MCAPFASHSHVGWRYGDAGSEDMKLIRAHAGGNRSARARCKYMPRASTPNHGTVHRKRGARCLRSVVAVGEFRFDVLALVPVS